MPVDGRTDRDRPGFGGGVFWLARAKGPLDQSRATKAAHACAWVVMPLLILQDMRDRPRRTVIPATTACEITAPVETVWQHVLGFGDLPPPSEKIFQLGIAYPRRARLVGHGVGAIRYCEFSTGSFVEPITAWEENRRLAF